MRLTEKKEKWSMGDKRFVGKKKNYSVKIFFSAKKPLSDTSYWYYFLSKDEFSYNSLWDGLKYDTKDACVKACEDKIDELTK